MRECLRAAPELVNVQPSGRWSALHQAAQAGSVGAVRDLLHFGANPLALTKDGQIPRAVAPPAAADVRRMLEVAEAGDPFEKAISDLFTMLDKNKNGEIDKTEQEEAMKNIHSMTLPKARWAWSDMDTDGDGKISESEFLKGMQAISDKVGVAQLLNSIILAWPDHPLALKLKQEYALEKAKKDKDSLSSYASFASFTIHFTP